MIKKSNEHLKKANETYIQHMGFALMISFQLLIAAIMAFIHALIPFIFTTGASDKIRKLYSFIENRK